MKHLLAVLLLLATATGFAQPTLDVAALLKTVPDLTAKLAGSSRCACRTTRRR